MSKLIKTYKVTVVETLEKEVEVNARTKEEALDRIEESYKEGDIILNNKDDITGTEIIIEEDSYGHKYRIDSTD